LRAFFRLVQTLLARIFVLTLRFFLSCFSLWVDLFTSLHDSLKILGSIARLRTVLINLLHNLYFENFMIHFVTQILVVDFSNLRSTPTDRFARKTTRPKNTRQEKEANFTFSKILRGKTVWQHQLLS
jgi:protein gp37